MGKKSSRQLWTAHLKEGQLPATGKVAAPTHAVLKQGKPFAGRVVGVDPSLRGTGLALVEWHPSGRAQLIRSETIRISSKEAFARTLGVIAERVDAFAQDSGATHAAVEQTIYVQNFQTAQILGAARGAAIATLARSGYAVHEYAPLSIKLAIVGFGRAGKHQVEATIRQICKLSDELPPDEADAAAAALCHAMTYREG